MAQHHDVDVHLHDETQVPLRWLAILAVGVAGLGVTFGSLISLAGSNERRITKIEQALEDLSKIDRRLARIEGSQGITAPKEERIRGVSIDP